MFEFAPNHVANAEVSFYKNHDVISRGLNMSTQIGRRMEWRALLAEGLVWACMAFTGCWIVFFLASLIQESSGFNCSILKGLFSPIGTAMKYLVSKGVISSENWPGGLLVCWATPWMIIGFLLGIYRGYVCGYSTMAGKSGCLLMSAVVVLTALIAVVFLFVF